MSGAGARVARGAGGLSTKFRPICKDNYARIVWEERGSRRPEWSSCVRLALEIADGQDEGD